MARKNEDSDGQLLCKVQVLKPSDRFPSNISILKLLDAPKSKREKKVAPQTTRALSACAIISLASWSVFGKHLVITLLETKGKDEKIL